MGVTAIARDEIVALGEGAAQKAAPERGVRHETDSELFERRQNVGLDIARPERILGFDSRDRVRLVGTAYSIGAGLAEAEVAHLALLNQARHGADRVLDRHIGIDPMDVIKVYDVDAEALEACFAGDRHIVGLAVDAAALPAWPTDIAELAGDEELVALALDGLTDELFVDAGRIGVRRVEHVDAQVYAAVDGLSR